MKNKLRIMECFGGIGACSKALERLNIDHTVVDYVEIDKYAVKSYNAIHETNFEPQDITQWDKDIEVDLIMHGSPCQDFSLAGKQTGGDEGSGTRSSLLYETIRIASNLKPKYVIWENVKNVLSKKHRHNFDNYLSEMEKLGYTNYYQVLNAKDYGIPQNRERVFTISILGKHNTFEFPIKQELKLKLKDMLESDVDEKYYLKEVKPFIYKKYNEYGEVPKMFNLYNKSEVTDIAPTQSTQCGSTTSSATILIKEATKQGYKEAYDGDGVNISSRMKYQRGNVQKESIQTITTSGGSDRGVVVKNQGKDIVRETDVCNTLMARDYKGFGNQEMTGVLSDLRIRKLTPKECWRLMGFDDEDFEKAEKVNSNTQLYKQAGNSICVPVLENIFKQLFNNY